MIIRKANDLDCYDVFQWRNDIISKQMFFNNKNLNYDEHLEWFQNILKDSHKTIYIGEDRGKKIGVCSIVKY